MPTSPSNHVAKCLVYYHPDDPEDLRSAQESKLQELYQACMQTGHELLLEVIPPSGSTVDASTIARAMSNIYACDIFPDWWKIAPPGDSDAWDKISAVINEHDPIAVASSCWASTPAKKSCRKGSPPPTARIFARASPSVEASSKNPAEDWFAGTINDDEAVRILSDNYRRIIDLWNNRNT